MFTSPSAHPSDVAAIVSSVGGVIATTLTAPMVAGIIVLLYADLRMRREGMDITLQAASANGQGTTTGGTPGSATPGSPTPGSPGPADASPGSAGPGTADSSGPDPRIGPW